jgi:thioester reductase-like protein
MKPNFKKMSVPELRKYVLAHRDDMEAIRALFHHPSLKYQEMPPLVTGDGLPIEENIRIAEEAIKQRVEIDRAKQKQREQLQEENLRQKLEQEIEEKLRAKIELEVEAKLQQKLEQEIEDLIGAIAEFLASTSSLPSRLAMPIALLAIRAGIEDFGDF